mgnify:CR=1 FL=1
MKIELKLELDTEKDKDELLLSRLIELFEQYDIDVFDNDDVDKT